MKKLIYGALALALLSFSSCSDDDDNSVALNGGTLSGGPFSFIVSDGIVDNVSNVSLESNTGTNSSFIVTDDAGNILGLPGDLTALEGVDFDGAGGGLCYIWHISYEDGLTGLEVGENTSDLSGAEFDLSNFIEVNRSVAVVGGTLSGGPFSFMVGDQVADNVSGITLEGNLGTNSSFIVTDDAGTILGLPGDLTALEGVDFDGAGEGLCYIWHISYEDGLTGLEADANTSDLSGDFSLSNSIEVNRVAVYSELTLDLSGLENLGTEYVYEGWIIVDGSPVTTGVFSVDDSGVLSETTFNVLATDLELATAFVLSIEPAVDPDPAPAATKLLIGDFSGDMASVSSTGMVGDFSTSTGSYILATPTDTDDSNEYSGIWFLDNSSGTAVAGLDLPTLPDGWVYEGWVVINGTPVSTGTFTAVDAADDNASTSPYKGTDNDGPAYPGEDYVMGAAAGVDFPTDLRGATAVISVEPYPDNSEAPFTLKPLAGEIATDAMVHTTQSLGTGPVVSISGTVTR